MPSSTGEAEWPRLSGEPDGVSGVVTVGGGDAGCSGDFHDRDAIHSPMAVNDCAPAITAAIAAASTERVRTTKGSQR